MARTTATIFGLALAAGAIGLNATRYPIVWQPAEPTAMKPPDVEPPAVEPSEKPSITSPPEATPPPAPPHLDETPPMVGEGTSTEQATPETAAMESHSSAPPVIEEPLAPVSFVGLSRGENGHSNARKEIRRLPPVDPHSAIPPDSWGQDGAIPIYPTTGID